MEQCVWKNRKDFVMSHIDDNIQLRNYAELIAEIAFTQGYDYAMRTLRKALENITELKENIENILAEDANAN